MNKLFLPMMIVISLIFTTCSKSYYGDPEPEPDPDANKSFTELLIGGNPYKIWRLIDNQHNIPGTFQGSSQDWMFSTQKDLSIQFVGSGYTKNHKYRIIEDGADKFLCINYASWPGNPGPPDSVIYKAILSGNSLKLIDKDNSSNYLAFRYPPNGGDVDNCVPGTWIRNICGGNYTMTLNFSSAGTGSAVDTDCGGQCIRDIRFNWSVSGGNMTWTYTGFTICGQPQTLPGADTQPYTCDGNKFTLAGYTYTK